MTRPHKSSIKRKVMTAIMLASLAVLLVTVVAFMVYDLVTFRQTMVQNLGTQARIIAENSTGDLAFKNENDAASVLNSLRTEPHIMAAAIYDANGKLFAKYPAQIPDAGLPGKPQSAGHQFEKSDLVFFQPVVQTGTRLGTLYLRSDLTAISQRLQLYAAISLLIMLGSLLVAFWLSNTLQRRISNPVIALAGIARKISEQRNYSFRAAKTSDDELGDLTDEFNSMLSQIQAGHSALSKSEEQLRIVADHASVYLCQFDRGHRFKFANRAYAERYNFEPLQLIGRHLSEVLGTAAYEVIQPHIDEAFAGKKVEFETEVPYATIGKRWVQVAFMPERNLEGQVVGVVAVINDITERKRAEEASRQLAAIVESSADAIISKDINGIIISWNRGAEQLFGYPAAEVIGRAITLLMPPDRWNEEPNILGRIRRGERMEHYETIRRRKDGSLIEISLTVSPIKDADGKVVGASKIARDISRQKQSERELERAHKEAVAASRAKDDFLAALSHELRTPLNPVLLIASDAAENSGLPPAIRADFEMIRRNVELEARLIDDLLDLTRITRGKLSLDRQSLDVHEVLHVAVSIIRPDAEAKKISLALELHAGEQRIVSGDAVRLQQVFWNVLKNAVKFTPDSGKITVKTFAENHALFIKVIDTGIGINDDELMRVFAAFSQGDHAAGGSHRFGGLGLGLAISQRLVELHSGAIHASSEGRDKGATFTIQLPLLAESNRKNGTTDPKPPEDSKMSGNGSRILLVEDHEPTRIALEHLLKRRNFEVVAVATVAEAREAARKGNIDLLISDIGLPDGNGYSLMGELRELYGLNGIALTGYGMEEDVAHSQKAGFIAHLTKPVRVQALENALATATNLPPKSWSETIPR